MTNIALLSAETAAQPLNGITGLSILNDIVMLLTDRLSAIMEGKGSAISLSFDATGLHVNVDLRGRDAVVTAELIMKSQPLSVLGISIGAVNRAQTPGSSFLTRITAVLT